MNDGVRHTLGSAEILFLRSLTIRQSDLTRTLGYEKAAYQRRPERSVTIGTTGTERSGGTATTIRTSGT